MTLREALVQSLEENRKAEEHAVKSARTRLNKFGDYKGAIEWLVLASSFKAAADVCEIRLRGES